MHIRSNDNVVMLQGKDRGKTGKILRVSSSVGRKGLRQRVMVEGLNKIVKHQRARRRDQKGQIVHKERFVDISSVQLVCPKCGKPTRIGISAEGAAKIRVCKKCKGQI